MLSYPEPPGRNTQKYTLPHTSFNESGGSSESSSGFSSGWPIHWTEEKATIARKTSSQTMPDVAVFALPLPVPRAGRHCSTRNLARVRITVPCSLNDPCKAEGCPFQKRDHCPVQIDLRRCVSPEMTHLWKV